MGNAQYARRDYRASIVTQRQLLKDFPDSSKAPDALLNIASAQSDMGDNAAARRTLEELIAKYPKSEAGTRARQRLGVRCKVGAETTYLRSGVRDEFPPHRSARDVFPSISDPTFPTRYVTFSLKSSLTPRLHP
jgi:tetratricopeptide (TPR) repeat protein